MEESAFHGKYVYKGEKVADYIQVAYNRIQW
jgi:hypothetical protein